MGLRRTTSVSLQLCATSSVPTSSSSKRNRSKDAADPPASIGVVLAAATTTAKDEELVKSAEQRVDGRIAAETAAAATKTLRERGLTGRTRLSRKAVLAAAYTDSRAEPDTSLLESPAVNALAGTVADGMAPALTEPTAVPLATNSKTDSSSPQPEIFAVGESGGFSPPSEHSTTNTPPMEGGAENASNINNMGLGGGEQVVQLKAPKRTKKEELPLKELRSSRRRSNQIQTPTQPVTQTNGKASKQRWSTGGNGGTVKAINKQRDVSDSSEADTQKAVAAAATGNHNIEIPTPPEVPAAPELVAAVEQPVEKEVGEEESGRHVNTIEQVEPSSKEEAVEVDREQEVPNNNNYLDKNRVPIISSAVKDERPPESSVDVNSVGERNGEPEESNSVAPSVIKEEEEGVVEAPNESTNTLGGPAAESEVWNKPNDKPGHDTTHLMTSQEFKAIVNDAALLEELVLMTPTKNLTEQLCMVLKDQERVLEQQEQEQQQQQQQQSQSSSQSLLKESAEMEQMLGDMAATSELDLLQVFKSFEGDRVVDDAAAGSEGNLLALLVGTDDDVDMMMAVSTSSPTISPLRERCSAGVVVTGSAPCRGIHKMETADREARDQREIVERKQMLTDMEQGLSQMQRRRDFLLRRLRKQQVHHMGRHLSEEVVGLFELSTRAASVAPKAGVADHATTFNKYLTKNAEATEDPAAATVVDLTGQDVEELTPASIVMRNESSSSIVDLKGRNEPTAVGHHPFIKPPSPKAILSFVKKVAAANSSGPKEQLATVLAGPSVHWNSNISKASLNNKGRLGVFECARSTLDDGHRLQLTNNMGLLKTEMRVVERAIDSEATASSSGGESADELINYSNAVQESLAIADRAAWRWAQDRARLASRWNWLTAEISDLEYRIRQHTDLHNQLRRSKGPVLLLRPATHTDLSAAKERVPATSANPVNVNGYRGLLPGQYPSSKTAEYVTGLDGFMADVENEVEGTSCRTRPYQRTSFKKRKLVQTMNLHTISKKAARPSSLKCGCQWPQQPCALCTGRCDPTVPRPLPDMIPRAQRAALLDPALHPCLSFPEDISQSIRFEAVLADPEWQHKVQKSSKAALKSSIVAAAAAAGGTYKSHKLSKKDDPKKAGKKYTQGLLSRYKKSKNKSRGTHTKFVHLLKQQKGRKAALKAGLGAPLSHGSVHYGVGLDAGEYETGVARSRNSSPTHNYYKQDRIERRSRISYDIDNIVIPYSVAASTRVEILPYKEIPTPKWKLVDETDLDEDIQVETSQYQQQQQQAASSDSNSSTITALEFDSEEFAEEYIQEKHTRALLEERKKFSTFLKFPYSTRSRANRRIDSRAESSGANTPDPASPAPNTPSIGGDHESIPSPICPSTPAHESVLESETSSQGPLNNIPVVTATTRISSERRRTISLKMLSHQNSTASEAGASRPRSHTPEPTGPQFESLTYPLSDRKYDDMLKQMPLNHERLDEYIKAEEPAASGGGSSAAKKAKRAPKDQDTAADLIGSAIGVVAENVSDGESLDSVIPEEDPNDPEWVVMEEE